MKSIFEGSSDFELIFIYNRIMGWPSYESCIPKDTSEISSSKVNDDMYDYMCGNSFDAIIRVFIV